MHVGESAYDQLVASDSQTTSRMSISVYGHSLNSKSRSPRQHHVMQVVKGKAVQSEESEVELGLLLKRLPVKLVGHVLVYREFEKLLQWRLVCKKMDQACALAIVDVYCHPQNYQEFVLKRII